MQTKITFVEMEEMFSPTFKDGKGNTYTFPKYFEPKGVDKVFWDQLVIESNYCANFDNVDGLRVITEIYSSKEVQ
jgi:hypothetical protein